MSASLDIKLYTESEFASSSAVVRRVLEETQSTELWLMTRSKRPDQSWKVALEAPSHAASVGGVMFLSGDDLERLDPVRTFRRRLTVDRAMRRHKPLLRSRFYPSTGGIYEQIGAVVANEISQEHRGQLLIHNYSVTAGPHDIIGTDATGQLVFIARARLSVSVGGGPPPDDLRRFAAALLASERFQECRRLLESICDAPFKASVLLD